MNMDFSWWWLGYPLLGTLVGFMAGLLGVGGGLITVPLLLFLHTQQHFPAPHLYKIVLASSMAAIMFTGFSSMMSHNRSGNVQWHAVRRLVPGLLIGALLGAALTSFISVHVLVVVFIAFALYTACQMFFNWSVSAHRTLPGPLPTAAFGGLTGVVSALISAGGGFLVVPFLTLCNVPMKKAVATSAACGFPIAVFGTIGYIYAGWGADNLPPYTLGFVHLPSVLGIALTSIYCATWGARVSAILPVKVLKKIFAVVLIGISASMVARFF